MAVQPTGFTVACWGCGRTLRVMTGPLWGVCYRCCLATAADGRQYGLACDTYYAPMEYLYAVAVPR